MRDALKYVLGMCRDMAPVMTTPERHAAEVHSIHVGHCEGGKDAAEDAGDSATGAQRCWPCGEPLLSYSVPLSRGMGLP